jgi:hypothetical protein
MSRSASLRLTIVLLLLAGCATGIRNTLAQDLAWERWQRCNGRYPTIQLKDIKPDGQIWIWNYGGADLAAVQQCLREAEQEQAKRGAAGHTASIVPGAAQSASAWDLPVWKRGYEWAYRWESPQGSGTFVWAVNRTEMLEGALHYVVKSGERREIFYRASDFAFYMDKLDGVVELRRAGNDYRVPWPLTPGKAWTMKATEERPKDRQTRDLRQACLVEGEELVTVPAGQFQTVKIICRDERTQAIVSEAWYAPVVKSWVRDRGRFDYGIRERELIDYRVK